MKILSTCFHPEFPAWTMPDWVPEEIERAFADVAVVRLTAIDRIAEEIVDADVWMTWKVTEKAFARAGRLKWIHTGMAGMTWILVPPVVESDVLVSNSRGVHAPIMGEHAMALMLAFSRRLHDCLDAQRQGLWARTRIYESVPTFDAVEGKRVGVLGLGAIGEAVAGRARCFGMEVVGFRRNPASGSEHASEVHEPGKLDDLLPSLDFLVIAAPLTPETERMIDARRLALMKPTAFLINLARGELVDQDALVEALEGDRLAGAGLDVFVPDPLPDGHPLFSVKNLILTPHISGTDPGLWRRITDLFIENIGRFREGRELVNLVDKEKGY